MKKHIICYFSHHSLIMILLLGLKTPAFPQNNILVWQDEFSVNGLPDEEKWGYDVGASVGAIRNYSFIPKPVRRMHV